MSNDSNKKGSGLALIPFLLFIVIYMGAGLILQSQGVDQAFYQFPSVVAILIAVVVMFFIGKGTVDQKFAIFAKGAGDENILIMLIIYVLAGAFSTVAGAMGGVDSTVNLGLSIIPAHFLTAGVFIISAFLGTATGTSMGTIGAIVPIALGVAERGGLNVALVMAACVGGAMFGDNLSMISDTTIAATRTQGCELKDKFRVNFLIALPAAVLTIILLLVFGAPVEAVSLDELSYSVIKVLPYLIVLIMALIGFNVFLVLGVGILAAGIVGLVGGELTILTYAQNIWAGFTSMNEVFFLSLFCGGLAEMCTHYGGIDWLINKVRGFMKSKTSAEIGISVLVSLADVAIANNTVAIIVSGPIAKDVSRIYKVDPRKTASLLDIFACVWQGLLPYSAQLLLVGSLSAGLVSPVDAIPYLWYQYLLALLALISIVVPFSEGICRKDPWNWEYDVAESGVAAKKAAMDILK